jgi:hypothetical protein
LVLRPRPRPLAKRVLEAALPGAEGAEMAGFVAEAATGEEATEAAWKVEGVVVAA